MAVTRTASVAVTAAVRPLPHQAMELTAVVERKMSAVRSVGV
jgi:hypothetical protein